MVELKKIATEQRNPNTMNIDTLSTLDMVKLINQEDHRVAEAVAEVTDKIAQAIDVIADRLSKGGRLIYCGAGTSGRLGILDASYAEVGAKIFASICRRYLTETDGKLNLGGICLVAGLGPENNRRRDGSYEYYISEPIVENDAKGLAPFLMCYTELLQSGLENA